MTKRKAKTAAKPSRRIAARAQSANRSVIRSPKPSRLRSLAAKPLHEISPKGHIEPKLETSLVRFDFSSATATARAYQAKLLEMAQANMQFALEFGPRLASVRSPVELLRVLEDVTKERITMFRKYSNEMVQLSMPR
jgi:hypothetical protein